MWSVEIASRKGKTVQREGIVWLWAGWVGSVERGKEQSASSDSSGSYKIRRTRTRRTETGSVRRFRLSFPMNQRRPHGIYGLFFEQNQF
jgi:hypothetical protein